MSVKGLGSDTNAGIPNPNASVTYTKPGSTQAATVSMVVVSDFPGTSASFLKPVSNIWQPVGPEGVPIGNGMSYASGGADTSMLTFGPDPKKATRRTAPAYVDYVAKHGKFAPTCGHAPKVSDITDMYKFECEYFGDLYLPNGQKYIGRNQKVRGSLPDCGSAMATAPISDETMNTARMLSAQSLDPSGVADLDPTMFQCRLTSNSWHI